MALAPDPFLPLLTLGTNVSPPLAAASTTDMTDLLTCGPLDITRLNRLLVLLANQINGNTIVGSSYNEITNVLTLTFKNGTPLLIDFNLLINDAISGALITASSYNATSDTLSLTFGNGSTFAINLTGLIADAVAAAFIPPRIVVAWSPPTAGSPIPTGWLLCDGANGTPNLQDKFIMGAGPLNPLNSTGGTAAHSHATTLANAITDVSITTTTVLLENEQQQGLALNSAFLNDPGHTHTATTAASSNLPPFHVLVYIMKV